MVLGSRDHRITHQLRPTNMNGRSILSVMSFLDRLRQRLGDQAHRDLRRERRLLRGLDLARVIEAVCSRYGVDRGQLAARGSRSPARAALAYLAKHHTEATRAELVPILGLSRPE